MKQNKAGSKNKIIYGVISILCLGIIYAALAFFNVIPVIGTVHVRGIFSDYDYTIMNNKVYLTKYHGDETKVIIPDKILFRKVVSIGTKKNVAATKKGTFQDNQKITSVNIPDTVKFIGALSFTNCKKLTVVKFPDNLETIGEKAFAHSSIIQIDIPEKTQYIYSYAFLDCAQLKEVNINQKLKYIGVSAFTLTPWLEAQTDDFVIVGDGILVKYLGGSRQKIVIPDGVKEICGDAFTDLIEVASEFTFDDVECVMMPKSIERIEDFALKGAGKTKVYFEDEDIDFGLYSIGQNYTIIAPKGSSAEKYAIDNKISYQEK